MLVPQDLQTETTHASTTIVMVLFLFQESAQVASTTLSNLVMAIVLPLNVLLQTFISHSVFNHALLIQFTVLQSILLLKNVLLAFLPSLLMLVQAFVS
jgi:hypothetical protein